MELQDFTSQRLAERLESLAEAATRGTDLFVVEVKVRGPKGNQIVDVFVDTDAGVGVDELAKYSRDLGFVLDTEDVMPGKYQLNVSSPGATRPLVLPRQFPRHIGRMLEVKLAGEGEAASGGKVTGTLVSVEADGFTLELPKGETRTVTFDQVREARVKLPW